MIYNMPVKTDLDAIKHIAKSMVYMDIQPTRFSPIVVHHPFTDTGITAVKRNNGFEMINLLEEPEGLAQWQKNQIRFISEAKDVHQVYMQVTKPFALAFLKQIEDCLSVKDLSTLLRSTWMRIEFVSDNPVYSKAQFARLFRKCDPRFLMVPDEYDVYQKLPETVEIYRGVRKNSKKVEGMSWTTDKTVADWFADRFTAKPSRGDVYKAVIDKRNILAFFSGRSEAEIVVDTTGLRNLEKLSRTPLLDERIEKAAKQNHSLSNGQTLFITKSSSKEL